jgi:hypothetical protein
MGALLFANYGRCLVRGHPRAHLWTRHPRGSIRFDGQFPVGCDNSCSGEPLTVFDREIWLRYITGWILFGIGTVICAFAALRRRCSNPQAVFTGMVKAGNIREWRGVRLLSSSLRC